MVAPGGPHCRRPGGGVPEEAPDDVVPDDVVPDDVVPDDVVPGDVVRNDAADEPHEARTASRAAVASRRFTLPRILPGEQVTFAARWQPRPLRSPPMT